MRRKHVTLLRKPKNQHMDMEMICIHVEHTIDKGLTESRGSICNRSLNMGHEMT